MLNFILIIYLIGCCHCTYIQESEKIPCHTYYETSCHKHLVSYSDPFHISCKIDENKIFKRCYLQTPEGYALFLNNKTNHEQGRIVSITNTSTCGALIKEAVNSDNGTWYCIVNMDGITVTGQKMVADNIKRIEITITNPNPNNNHTAHDGVNCKENINMIKESEKSTPETEKKEVNVTIIEEKEDPNIEEDNTHMQISTSLPNEEYTIKNDTRIKEDTSKVDLYSDENHITKNHSLTKDDELLIWKLKRNQNIIIYIISIFSFISVLCIFHHFAPILCYLVAKKVKRNS